MREHLFLRGRAGLRADFGLESTVVRSDAPERSASPPVYAEPVVASSVETDARQADAPEHGVTVGSDARWFGRTHGVILVVPLWGVGVVSSDDLAPTL